jgi:hypothetical protein
MKTAIDEVFSALIGNFQGDLLRPQSVGYPEARRVWNGMVARTPGLIARCADVADVQSAVRAAGAAEVLTAVRCGGHSLAGHSTCEGGLVIDLTRLRQVEVDGDKRRARFAGGCLLGTVDRATQSAKLVFPAGVVSETGAAGLILGGGYGWLTRRFGLSCDNVEGFTMVAADGSIQRASARENADLFWALRGGGGNFGVVTGFAVRLHPLSSLLFATAEYVGDDIPRILEYWREFMAQAPDELKWSFSLRPKIASCAVTWIGDPEQGRAAVDAALAVCGAKAITRNVMSFCELQTAADWEFPAGRRYYTKSGYLKKLDDRSLQSMIKAMDTMPSAMSQIEISYQGGAAARVGAEETAFGDRSSPFIVNILGSWAEAAEDAANVTWARALFAELQPSMTPGAYVNFMSGDEEGRVQEAYRERWDRLVAVKTHYDPTNFFRLNANIRPDKRPAGANVAPSAASKADFF